MNGSEIETRLPQDNLASELTDSEKMDLVAGDNTPYANAIKKLMRFEVTKAQTEAVECDPSDEKKQRSLMTIAHAMEKFRKNLLGAVTFEKSTHYADVKLRVAQEELKDQEKLDAVILFNQTH
jgi:hypothetical protein